MYSFSSLRFFLLLFGFGLFANGCGCGDVDTDFPPIRFDLYEELTGKNIYGWDGLYSEDSLKIYQMDGTEYLEYELRSGDGKITFFLPMLHKESDIENTSTFLLRFSSTDIDTLSFLYRYEIEKKCQTVDVLSMKAIYNRQLYQGQSPLLSFDFYKE